MMATNFNVAYTVAFVDNIASV